ncbi:MAG: RsmE family RNA methyltransferase [Anaerolineae bacterium]|jgi:16S rRNA (uracil1498-N3)-methyltransferase
MHRFFIPPSWIRGNEVEITGPQAHQVARVLRMRPGDRIIVLDNSGWEIETKLVSVDPRIIRGKVVNRRLASSEPRTKISLYQSVLKSKGFELALQKATELGVVEFVPLISDRCIVSDLEAVSRKRRRWERIIQEATEQCRRGRKPALRSAALFPQACERARQSGGLSLIPWEEECPVSLRDLLQNAPPGREQNWPPFTINLFIGPEGGFTRDEIVIAQGYDLVPVTLGPRILRADMAGIVTAAMILYELGDLG